MGRRYVERNGERCTEEESITLTYGALVCRPSKWLPEPQMVNAGSSSNTQNGTCAIEARLLGIDRP